MNHVVAKAIGGYYSIANQGIVTAFLESCTKYVHYM